MANTRIQASDMFGGCWSSSVFRILNTTLLKSSSRY